eukprot:GHVT01017184.1.p2 GENE.GHVT01017184.1~~GHVT01017184.1.p2  ORF type:complete len:367 (+),score=84.48 GHVT01017184.1:2868-3968(+)
MVLYFICPLRNKMSRRFFDKLLTNGSTSSAQFHSTFGANILKKFGWKEGEGLGASGDGRVACVQVKRRKEKEGLGSEVAKPGAATWSRWWEDLYNTNAATIKSRKDAEHDDLSTTTSSSDSDSDEEPGGTRPPERRREALQRGKLARVKLQEAAAAAAAAAPDGNAPAAAAAAEEENESDELRKSGAKELKKRKKGRSPRAAEGCDQVMSAQGSLAADPPADNEGKYEDEGKGDTPRSSKRKSKRTKATQKSKTSRLDANVNLVEEVSETSGEDPRPAVCGSDAPKAKKNETAASGSKKKSRKAPKTTSTSDCDGPSLDDGPKPTGSVQCFPTAKRRLETPDATSPAPHKQKTQISIETKRRRREA